MSMNRVITLFLAAVAIAACAVDNEHDGNGNAVKQAHPNRVASVRLVNTYSGVEESFILHYDQSERLVRQEHFKGYELIDKDTLIFTPDGVIIQTQDFQSSYTLLTDLKLENGVAVKKTVNGENDKIVYKNGYLVSDSRLNKSFTWKDGDIMISSWDGKPTIGGTYPINVTYTWTGFDNIFSDEEYDPSLPFGGYSYYRYFGKRCAHLPESVYIDYSSALPLFLALDGEPENSSRGSTFKKYFSFSYEFDDRGRPIVVNVLCKFDMFTVTYPEKTVEYRSSDGSLLVFNIQYVQP